MHQSFESPTPPTPPYFHWLYDLESSKKKKKKENQEKAIGFENIERTNRSLGITSMKLLLE